jgi:hypothetical protein
LHGDSQKEIIELHKSLAELTRQCHDAKSEQATLLHRIDLLKVENEKIALWEGKATALDQQLKAVEVELTQEKEHRARLEGEASALH